MGFEVLAGLKQQLAEQAKREVPKKGPATASPRHGVQNTQDPALAAISRLQRHYPAAFPRKPAPKRPLKIGILNDLQMRTEHGLDAQALGLALTAWSQGQRYWECLKPGEARVDVTGAVAGEVTQAQAQRAKQLLWQQRRPRSSAAAKGKSPTHAKTAPATRPDVPSVPASIPHTPASTPTNDVNSEKV